MTDVILQRKWLTNPHPAAAPCSGNTFSIVTYNILADCYWASTEKSHPWCPKGMRTATERMTQMLKELVHHDADIICLQEVSTSLYKNHLKSRLSELGYHSSHHTRGQYDEGVATFFRSKRFELVKEKFLRTHDLISKALEESGAPKSLLTAVQTHAYYQRPIILSGLRCRQTNQILNLCNVHITWDIEHMDRMLFEVTVAINELINFAGGVDKPHILCGDFNHEPWTPGYHLLQNGAVSNSLLEQMKRHTLPEKHEEGTDFLVDVIPDKLKHNSRLLQSAYKIVTGDEPSFTSHGDDAILADPDTWPGKSRDEREERRGDLRTNQNYAIDESSPASSHTTKKAVIKDSRYTNFDNFKDKYSGKEIFIGTLDYIWYSSDSLYCKGVLEMVDECEVSRFHSAPNEVFPSDHMLMKAQFQFVQGSLPGMS